MNAIITEAPQASYEQDFYAWTQDQANLVRARRFDALDIGNLAEEIESMGRSELRAVSSFTFQILVHLLCLRYSPARDPREHWTDELRNFRREIDLRLHDSPSLRPKLADVLDFEWPHARREALARLRRDAVTELPAACPFTLAQVLDFDYLPGQQP